MATERSPLLANQAAATHDDAAYTAAAESAIQSVIHGDVNASAFQVPATTEEEDEEEAAVPEGVLVTETPMRADLYLVLAGMW